MKLRAFLARALSRIVMGLSLIPLLASAVWSQDVKPAEREYPVSVLAAKTALQQLGAYTGTRLPTLEGFVKTDNVKLDLFQRPYYEFKIDLVPSAADRTVVRVSAKISAWYTGQSEQPGYKILETNGRLESDLLDRLDESLQKNGPPVVEPGQLSSQIAELHRKRLEVEQRILSMEQGSPNSNSANEAVDAKEFATIIKGNSPILRSPSADAGVLMRAQPEDEFEIAERRGSWLAVKMDEGRTGWIQQSFTRNAKADLSLSPATQLQNSLAGFTVLRENTQPFAGDWDNLKGKTSRYIFVRPMGSSINSSPVNKLHFAQTMFSERGRQTLHSSRNTLDGMVIVFLDQGGGVAAATFEDIRSWLSGKISSAAFLKRCSFDPPSQFANSRGQSKSASSRKQN